MRKLTLLTSVLLASSFQTVNVSAQCMNTINCQTLGYTKTSCTKGGVKCPTGNYWYCPKDTTTPQCSSSYKYTCTGAYQSPSGTACNGKYQKCNCSNNYVWNSTQGRCLAGSGSGSGGSSSGSDTCTDRIPYPPYAYQYTSKTGCGGSFYSERVSICGETIYVCSNGRSVGYDYNVRCEYDDRVTLRGYYITHDHNYNMCQNSSGQLKEGGGGFCEYARGYGNTRYATLEECERVAATYDDPHVTFTYACGPCVY